MKNKTLLFATTISTLAVASYLLATPSSPQAIEYQVDANVYAVTVPVDGVSKDKAKDIAMQKAAELCQKNGYRYFTISSEQEVYVIKSTPDQKAPVNQYYEMIQSDNFGKNPIGQEPNLSPQSLYTGWKIKFACFKESPGSNAIDSCKYTSCGK